MLIEEILSYENVKEFLVYAAFGSLVGMAAYNIACCIAAGTMLAWKALKKRFGRKNTEDKNHEQNLRV